MTQVLCLRPSLLHLDRVESSQVGLLIANWATGTFDHDWPQNFKIGNLREPIGAFFND